MTIISRKVARQLQIKTLGQQKRTIYSGTLSSEAGTVDTLRLGGLSLPKQRVEYPSDDDARFSPVLGVDILSNYLVFIDIPNMRMFLKPANPY